MRRFLPVLTLLALLPGVPALAQNDVEAKIDVLAEEIARLREQLAIPETDQELKSLHGLGPAASKVYQARNGISLGGYGEFYFSAPLDDQTSAVNTADFYRFITYFGYKFSDRILMNTEIEFEHATTGNNFADKAGEVSVEFSYLDFLLHESFNLRTGNLLVPMGIVNVMHEPAFYRGNFRPEIEGQLIPSTWRELGIAAHGQLGEFVRYDAALLNGLNGARFDTKGVRGGRQKGNRVLFEDVAGVLALNAEVEGITAGVSLYSGGADQNRIANDGGPVDVANSILETHLQWRGGGADLRAQVIRSRIHGAKGLTDWLNDGEDPEDFVLIPSGQIGFLVEAAYDVAPWILGPDSAASISPWFRYETWNLHDEVPSVDGLTASPQLDGSSVTIGVDVKPHPNVVLKADWVHTTNAADTPISDELRVGAGFVY